MRSAAAAIVDVAMQRLIDGRRKCPVLLPEPGKRLFKVACTKIRPEIVHHQGRNPLSLLPPRSPRNGASN